MAMSEIDRFKAEMREKQAEMGALDEELAIAKRRNTQLMGLLMALMVLHGEKRGEEWYRMRLPYSAVRAVPTTDYTLTNRPHPAENYVELELRRAMPVTDGRDGNVI